MLKGKYINLRKVEENDLLLLKEWLTRPDFAAALRGSLLNNEAQGRVVTMIEANLQLFGDLQYFMIENKKSERTATACMSTSLNRTCFALRIKPQPMKEN